MRMVKINSKMMVAMTIVSLLFLLACNPHQEVGNEGNVVTDINDNQEVLEIDNKEIEDMKDDIVTVEKFMDYYGITESEIPKDYILDYIMQYRYREKDLEKWDLGTKVKNYYSIGKKFGKDPGRIFQGETSEISLEKYMEEVDVIEIQFSMRYGNELSYPRIMTIDLEDNMIYFADKSTNDFTDASQSAKLSDEDVLNIREQLPKHIVEGEGKTTKDASFEYSFIIKMKADDYSSKFYRGESGDESNFPGFDEYWKDLYKEVFDEEFVFQN